YATTFLFQKYLGIVHFITSFNIGEKGYRGLICIVSSFEVFRPGSFLIDHFPGFRFTNQYVEQSIVCKGSRETTRVFINIAVGEIPGENNKCLLQVAECRY